MKHSKTVDSQSTATDKSWARVTSRAWHRVGVGALAVMASLSACTSVPADVTIPESNPPKETVPAEPEATPTPEEETSQEDSFPALNLGDFLGEPEWARANAALGMTSMVSADRLIFIDGDTATALGPNGNTVWELTSLQEANREEAAASNPKFDDNEQVEVATVGNAFATMKVGSSASDGLDRSTEVSTVNLYSLESGELTNTVEVPGRYSSSLDLSNRPQFLEFQTQEGDIHLLFDDGKTALVSQGDVGGAILQARPDGTIVYKSEHPTTGMNFVSGSGWETALVDLAGSVNIETLNPVGEVALVSLFNGGTVDPAYSEKIPEDLLVAIDMTTGKELYSFTCTNWKDIGYSHISPDGNFASSGNLVYGRDGAACLGGGDQQNVVFTATANDGNAYGITEEGQLIRADIKGATELLDTGTAIWKVSAILDDTAIVEHRSNETLDALPDDHGSPEDWYHEGATSHNRGLFVAGYAVP